MASVAMTKRSAGYVVPASEWNQLIDNDEACAVAQITTAGDLFYGTGSRAGTRLGIGSIGTILKSTGSAPSWAGLSLYKTGANTAITTSETTVLTTTVSGNTLGTAGVILIKLAGTVTQDSGGDDKVTIKLKYGATTLATGATTDFDAVDTYTWNIDAYLIAMGATNSQYGQFLFSSHTSANQHRMAEANGTASEDSTADKTLAVTMQFDGSGIAGACRAAYAIIL